MRSVDFTDSEATYTRIFPNQMIRIALVNGLNHHVSECSDRYLAAVRYFTRFEVPRRIEDCRSIMSQATNTPNQTKYLDDLLTQLDYRSQLWTQFDYPLLEEAGFVREVDSLEGLLRAAHEYDPTVVYCFRGDILDPDKDFLKHVDWRNRLRLNSKQVVYRFSVDKGFDLPSSFLRFGKLTTAALAKLDLFGFTFIEAFRAGINCISKTSMRNEVYTTLSFRNPTTRDQTRFHIHDFVEALEHFIHRRTVTGEEIRFPMDEPERYARTELAHIPKRKPGDAPHPFNEVEVHYMPNFGSGREAYDWMYVQPRCNCQHGFNLRNFQDTLRGSKRVVWSGETHFFELVLHLLSDKESVRGWKNPKNLVPIARESTVRLVDMLRYNVYREVPTTRGLRRRGLSEIHIEAVLFELAKRSSYEKMFYPVNEIPDNIEAFGYTLRPIYIRPPSRMRI
ncbi:hypothetical protein KY320_02415 [Candidatus Woesearchaeota archaeon]|nr:hypothetical protein [Candidatus Woesearchaeota archaeon]